MNRKEVIVQLVEALFVIIFFELAILYLRPVLVDSILKRLVYFALLFVGIKSIRYVIEHSFT